MKSMLDRPETMSLLRGAHDEILMLRRQIAELSPKAHAYDTIAQLARLSEKDQSRTYGEDMAWRLKNAVEVLTAEREAEKAAGVVAAAEVNGAMP